MDVKFDIKGAQEIERILKQMPIKYERRIAKNALRAAARVIRNEAKRRVPVDTGNLKKSISVVTLPGRIPAVAVTNKRGKGEKNDGWYAHLVEFGTKPHSTAKGGRKAGLSALDARVHPGTPARPFLRPALDNKSAEAIQIIADATGKALARLARK